jgi:hypothetical protein
VLASVRPALVAALIATVGAAIVLHLWDADLGVPFRGTGDTLFFQMLVKDALGGGWVLTNPHLGAPFGQELYDYPVAGADTLQFLAIKILGLFSSNAAVVFNVYFLLTFPLAAIAAYAVLRWLELSVPVAVIGAVLFALAPYHFLRGEFHYFLAATWPIPLGAYLVLAIYLGTPLFGTRQRTIATLAICVAVGLSDFYYAAFTALLAGAATLLATAVRRQRQTFLAGAFVTLAVVAATGLALAPSLVYRAQHGANQALERAPSESELYSLNVIGLVMPVEDHRIDRLASIRERYQRSTSVGKEAAPLGLLGAVGFVWLLALALAICVGARGGLAQDPRQRSLATANLTALLIGTTGGASAIIAYAVGPELRTWSRLSVFIAFFAIAALCLLADAARPWVERRGPRARIAAAAAVVGIAVLAVADGTSPSMTPDYAQVAASYHSDDAFVNQIEQTVGPDAQVFQMPYQEFPDEIEFAGLQDYDGARGYLHSDSLRWSWGAMKGRPRDWQAETVNLPATTVMPMVAAAGFQGVYLDRFGYSDDGEGIEKQLGLIIGVPPISSPDRRLAFFDLRSYARRLRAERSPSELAALADVTLHPVRTAWSTDSFNKETRDGLHLSRWTSRESSRIELTNPSDRPRVTALSVKLSRPGAAPADVVLRYPDGQTQHVWVTPEGKQIEHSVRVPAGESAIEIETAAVPLATAAGANSPGFVQLTDFQLIPSEARELSGSQ